MKVSIAFILAVMTFNPAIAGDGKVASLSSRPGPADPSRDVKAWHNEQHGDCKFDKVLEVGPTTSSETGVENIWTVEACGKKFLYRVLVIGKSTVMVSNADGSPAVSQEP